jgi:phosphatidylglycerol:prolipoprotein diacylglycerol transferase
MILTLVLLGALLPFHQRLKARLPDGALGLTYLGLYGLGRFFLSYMRTDPAVFAGLRQAQLGSMLMFVIAVVAIPILVRRQTSAVHHQLVLEPAFAPATTPSDELETAPEPASATTSEIEPAASSGPSAESGAPGNPARPQAPRRPRTKTRPKTPEPPADLPG